MKLIRNLWVMSGMAALGLIVAACSSKTTDNGSGAGGTASTMGGGGSGNSAATGGESSASIASGGAVASSTGGGTGINSATYCNGLLQQQTCSQTSVQADVRTVNMLIVLDESGSMSDSLTTGGPSKWDIMKTALNSALSTVDSEINFGLLLFPYKDGGISPNASTQAESCALPSDATAINVPITSGPSSFQNVIDKIDGQTPAGGTPTQMALQQAYNYFTSGDGRNLNGSKWVLLATDGGPNCDSGITCTADTCTANLDQDCTSGQNCCEGSDSYICLDDLATTSQISKLALAGIDTFVVGVPGSEAYATYLNAFAIAGGMPNTTGAAGESYYAISAASAQQDLINAFGSITTQRIKSCDFELASTPKSNSLVQVAIDCNLQTQVPAGSPADAAGVDGFYVDDSQTPAHIMLVGAPCNNIQEAGAHHVDVIVGCKGAG